MLDLEKWFGPPVKQADGDWLSILELSDLHGLGRWSMARQIAKLVSLGHWERAMLRPRQGRQYPVPHYRPVQQKRDKVQRNKGRSSK